jgi:hypothetical protein
MQQGEISFDYFPTKAMIADSLQTTEQFLSF